MLRGYRCILIAVVGWLSLAASQAPNKRADGNQTQARAAIKESLSRIADAQAKQAEAGQYEAPCDDGEYNNESDLCAQWYAARAARDAANWAYWSVFWSVVSLGLSAAGLAALMITIRQGHRGLERAREANEIARDDGRPWLIFKKAHTVRSDQGGLGFRLQFANIGARPAERLQIFMEPRVVQDDSIPVFDGTFPATTEQAVVGPHEPLNSSRWYPLQGEGNDWIAGTARFWIYAKIRYYDPYTPQTERICEVCCKLRYMGMDGDNPKIIAQPQGPQNLIT